MSKKTTFFQEFIPKSFICLRDHYSWQIFKKDLIAGVTVGVVALPLAMAFAIASGVSPEKGLYTAIVAGFLTSLLGGSRVQIGGPTGAFVVIVYDVIQRHGYEGLCLATLIAAVFLILLGLFRLGTLIKYIPYPLTTGFTSGIAVLIFSSQIKDFFGLQMGSVPSGFIEKWQAYFYALPSWHLPTFCVASASLACILMIRRLIPVVPWGIATIVLMTFFCSVFDIQVETIASRFGGIPRSFPTPTFPSFSLSLDTLHALIPDAITIALLAGIESLLSAVVADGMSGGRHKSNCELVAQGLANIGSIAFGGIPATGAIARTATNVKTGARTPVAGMIHALTLALIILFFAPLVSRIPLAALSAVLVMVAWNMSEVGHFRHLFKAPGADVAVLLTAFLLTVFVDLTVAVEVGMILAAFFFMKKMSDFSGVVSVTSVFREEIEEFPEKSDPDAIMKKKVPEGIEVYEVEGPFFFGVADHLKDVLQNIEYPPRVFILRMRKVPFLDASGLAALKEFYHKCQKEGSLLILSGIRSEPAVLLKKYGLEELIGKKNIYPHIDAALKRASEFLKMS
ncbi:MAG: SulP family inorganic anion transporter [Anaerolineae bacterium]